MIANQARDAFSRLHRAFSFHLGVATALAWLTALYAAAYAPWVRNIRALIDPMAGLDRIESTFSYLFAMPAVLALAWISIVAGRESLRRAQTLCINLMGHRGIGMATRIEQIAHALAACRKVTREKWAVCCVGEPP